MHVILVLSAFVCRVTTGTDAVTGPGPGSLQLVLNTLAQMYLARLKTDKEDEDNHRPLLPMVCVLLSSFHTCVRTPLASIANSLLRPANCFRVCVRSFISTGGVRVRLPHGAIWRARGR
jgi:hypothetical protein